MRISSNSSNINSSRLWENGVDGGNAQRRATRRVLDHYLHTAHAANRLLHPHRLPIRVASPAEGVAPEPVADQTSAWAWFTEHHAVLLAAVTLAAEAGYDTYTWQLAWTLANYLERRGYWPAQLATQRLAVAAADRLGDLAAQANANRGLAIAYSLVNQLDAAHQHHQRAADLFSRLGDDAGQAHTNIGLGGCSPVRAS
jgi:hypothetical protein